MILVSSFSRPIPFVVVVKSGLIVGTCGSAASKKPDER
jgi:hypothetical protein